MENDTFKKIRLLGQGTFGKAYLCICQTDSSYCVVKEMDIQLMSKEEQKETIKESQILEALQHPNIVRFREVYQEKGKLCIVMDYADGGDLAQRIKQNKQGFDENQIIDWFTQLCLAVKHVHDRKIIHRDLKTQNIFLTKDNIIKLGDFGIACVLNHTRDKAKTMVGTPYYISPEIIDSKPYSFQSDIWSLGIILYELCCLKPPFDAESLQNLALKIVRGFYQPIPSHYSKDLHNLISMLLNIDMRKRPTVNEILKLPLLTNRIRKFLSESVSKIEFSHTILHKQHFVDFNENIFDKKKKFQQKKMIKIPSQNSDRSHQIKENNLYNVQQHYLEKNYLEKNYIEKNYIEQNHIPIQQNFLEIKQIQMPPKQFIKNNLQRQNSQYEYKEYKEQNSKFQIEQKQDNFQILNFKQNLGQQRLQMKLEKVKNDEEIRRQKILKIQEERDKRINDKNNKEININLNNFISNQRYDIQLEIPEKQKILLVQQQSQPDFKHDFHQLQNDFFSENKLNQDKKDLQEFQKQLIENKNKDISDEVINQQEIVHDANEYQKLIQELQNYVDNIDINLNKQLVIEEASQEQSRIDGDFDQQKLDKIIQNQEISAEMTQQNINSYQQQTKDYLIELIGIQSFNLQYQNLKKYINKFDTNQIEIHGGLNHIINQEKQGYEELLFYLVQSEVLL